jgi:cellulose synthase (UDP-forming)
MFRALTALTLIGIVWFAACWVAADVWSTRPALMTVLSLALLVLLVKQQGAWFLLPAMRRPLPMPARDGWRVGVATTYVPGTESLEMLERTVRALVALEYPHETWVLDEGDRPEVLALCVRLGAHHFSRATRPDARTDRGAFQYPSKHGNYNAWLHEIAFDRYDIVSAFDPDHIPDPIFLDRVLGYFNDPQVGYVQTPQAYSNQEQGLVARGAAEETYGFYSSFQMGCYGCGHALVIGCHSTHRVSALKAAGGFAAHDADDLLLTLHYRRLGWAGVYVPEVLARGLTPADWASYLAQQRRWARAILDLKCRVKLASFPSLPWTSRVLGRMQGLGFLLTSGALVALLIGGAILIASGEVSRVWTVSGMASAGQLILSVALCRAFSQRFYLDPGQQRRWHWRATVLQLVKLPWLLMAVGDVLLDRRMPYVTTPKPAPSRPPDCSRVIALLEAVPPRPYSLNVCYPLQSTAIRPKGRIEE